MQSAIAARKAKEIKVGDLSKRKTPALSAYQPRPTPSSTGSSKRKASPKLSGSEQKKRQRDGVPKLSYSQQAQEVCQDNLLSITDDIPSDSEMDIEVTIPEYNENVAPCRRSPSIQLADSSDEEETLSLMETRGEPADLIISARKLSRPPVANIQYKELSSFKPVLEQNITSLSKSELRSMLPSSSSNECTLLFLEPGETLTLLGTCSLSIIKGSLSVSGCNLHPSIQPHHIFAPRCSPLPVLRSVSHSSDDERPDLLLQVPPRLHKFWQRNGTLLVVDSLRTGIEGLGDICTIFDGTFELESSTAIGLGVSGLSAVTQKSRSITEFSLPVGWEQSITSVLNYGSDRDLPTVPVCMVCGSKRTGKSSFARLLMNRLLERYARVAYLETDLGQSEFTPGGMVALNILERPVFGPPFTHPTLPFRAHFVGSTTPRSSPSCFLEAIYDLIQTYRLDVQQPADFYEDPEPSLNRITDYIPLVSNTMGWSKGLGADLIRKINDALEPTRVFAMADPTPVGYNMPGEPSQLHHDYDVTILEPIPSSALSDTYSAADMRTISLLSYFHACFPCPAQAPSLRQCTATTWRTALPLCAMPPYEVNADSAFDQIILIGAGMEDVADDEIKTVLNGAVAGLVSDDHSPTEHRQFTHGLPYSQANEPPSPTTSACHGLALVRSLSSTGTTMHVLTPLPAQALGHTRVLVKGELEIPVWAMLDFRDDENGVAGVERDHVPFLSWSRGEGYGGEKRRVRRNLMRRGQR